MASRYIHVENTVDKAWMKIVRHGAHGRYIIDCTLIGNEMERDPHYLVRANNKLVHKNVSREILI
jgi:hypothetical protein